MTGYPIWIQWPKRPPTEAERKAACRIEKDCQHMPWCRIKSVCVKRENTRSAQRTER